MRTQCPHRDVAQQDTQVHIHNMGVGCPRLHVPVRRKFCDRYGGRADTLVRYADRDASASHEQAAQEHCETASCEHIRDPSNE